MNAKLSELKLNKVRKVLKYEVDGVEKQITIYNAIGKKRENLLKMFQIGSRIDDKDKAASMMYESILKELVEIDIDTKGFKSMFKSPSMTLLELNHTIEEILHEIQYEFITSQIRQLNATRLSTITAISMEKAKQLQEDVEGLKNANI